jgi:hypothetical protein
MASGLAGRHGAAAALRIGYIAQALAIAASGACMLLDAPPPAVYAGAVVAASAVTLIRPAQGALLPALVETPAQLTAANVVSGWVESVSLLVGPALAGGLITVDGPGAALILFAGAVTASAALVAPLRGPTGSQSDEVHEPRSVVSTSHSPTVLALLAVGATQFIAIGAMDVLEVVLALKVLALGASGAGYLAAAFGAGSIVGGIGAVSLVGRHRLVGALLGASIVWGLALAVLGAWPAVGAAFAALAAAGVMRTLLDVSGRTLLHRAVPAELHGRVFGVLEGLSMLGLAFGSLLVPVIAGLGSAQAALVGVGGLLVVVPLGAAATLRAFEREAPRLEVELDLLRGSPLFGMLAPAVLEDLSRALVRIEVPAAAAIIREGELGDRFYLLAAGELVVSIGGEPVRTIAAGDGFGEIALLRDGIRVATVTANGPATVYALNRAPFLEALTGSRQASRVAEELVVERLGS